MTLNLVEDGIFPIIYDENGVPFNEELDTGLKVPGSVQGEGKLVGTPSLFLRLSGCNLRCAWFSQDGENQVCDTPYSSFTPDKNQMDIKKIADIIRTNLGQMTHLVVTGGEPMLQAKPLTELLKMLKKDIPELHVTLETNGTLYYEELIQYLNLVSLSPKLRTSLPSEITLEGTGVEYNEKRFLKHEHFRKNIAAIQAFIDSTYAVIPDRIKRKPRADFQLKFVVSDLMDVKEIEDEFLPLLKGVEKSDIYLMPLGLDPMTLAISSKFTMQATIEKNWRFSPRLQIDLFGTKRSV